MKIQDHSDLLARGFLDRNTNCFIDTRICDMNQPSYLAQKPNSIIKIVENDKKYKYLDTCLK